MNRDKINLMTILDYIDRVQKYIDWYDFLDFMDDEKTYDACCMLLQQIWELANKLEDKVSLKIIPIDKMRWLRNRITHDYMWIDSEIIWDTINESLPDLIIVIKKVVDSI